MQDLGHLLPSRPLLGNSSQAATNTISDETGSMTAPGTPSESTSGVTASVAGFVIPPCESLAVTTGHDWTPPASPWTRPTPSHPIWKAAADQPSQQAQQPRATDGTWKEL